jgi:hypothetical protein
MQKPGKLTREQRMTPYERMLQEKRAPTRTNFPHLCYNEPVMAFRPGAVAYMPML